jgi:hypothetical protein
VSESAAVVTATAADKVHHSSELIRLQITVKVIYYLRSFLFLPAATEQHSLMQNTYQSNLNVKVTK